MSDKEQLEYIKEFTGPLLDSQGRFVGLDLTKNEFDFLVKQAEQKIRLKQKYENTGTMFGFQNQRILIEENKRLREALKYYADEKKYEENIKTTYGYTCEIACDEGNTAKKAMEQSK